MNRERLSPHFVYESYDPDSGLFVNQGSIGFVLQAFPLVGAGLTEQGEISDFLSGEDNLPEGASLQVTLVASRHVEPILQRWASFRIQPLFQELAARRAAHLFRLAEREGTLKTFFLLISATFPTRDCSGAALCRIQKRREALHSTLSVMGMVCWDLDDAQLLSHLRDWFEWERELRPPINPRESLSEQIVPVGTDITEEKQRLLLNEDRAMAALSPTPSGRPEAWVLPKMDLFLGDEMRRGDQVRSEMMLTTCIHVLPSQGLEKGVAMSKREARGRELRSRLLKWLPDLQEEYHDIDQFLVSLRGGADGGAKIIRLFQVAVLKDRQDSLREHLFEYRSLLRRQGFSFSPCTNDHLAVMMASLPMQTVCQGGSACFA